MRDTECSTGYRDRKVNSVWCFGIRTRAIKSRNHPIRLMSEHWTKVLDMACYKCRTELLPLYFYRETRFNVRLHLIQFHIEGSPCVYFLQQQVFRLPEGGRQFAFGLPWERIAFLLQHLTSSF